MPYKNEADKKAYFAAYNKTERAREMSRERNRKYRERHKERCAERSRAWVAAHPEKRKEVRRASEKKAIETLSDHYIRKTISKVYAIKEAEIPAVIVSVHREILKLKREVRNEERA